MRPQCFGELSALAASEGYDSPAAYESALRSRRELARVQAAMDRHENTLDGSTADGARGDPATGFIATSRGDVVPHETKIEPSSPFPSATDY